MTDPNAPVPGEKGTPGDPQTPKQPETAEQLKDSLYAARRREKEAADKLADTQKRLDALEAERKEREEAELSESEKLKKQIAEAQATIESLTGYKDKWSAHEQALSEQIEKDKEGLTDSQKAIVDGIDDLTIKAKTIAEFKQTKKEPGNWGKGDAPSVDGVPTAAEAMEIRAKYGVNSHEYMTALKKRRDAGKINV